MKSVRSFCFFAALAAALFVSAAETKTSPSTEGVTPFADPVFPFGLVYFRKSSPPKEDWARDHQVAAQPR